MKSRNKIDLLEWLSTVFNKYQLGGFIIIAVAIVFYNIGWDFIVGAKILAFNSSSPATVWDMGAFYERIWASVHSQTVNKFLLDVIPSPITLILSPLLYFNSPFFFAYLQTAWISLTAVPLYFLSLRKLQSVTVAVILSVTFLIFFGIAGLNWFDIHFQTLFLPLFIAGICLFYYGRYKSSAVFMVLAGSVHYLMMIFPILFYVIYFVEMTVRDRKFKVPKMSVTIPAFVSLIFLTGSIYVEYHVLGATNITGSAHIAGAKITSILSSIESSSIDNEIQTFLLYLAPFMMLPLLSKRWVPSMLIFFFLLFFAGNYIFYFPGGLRLTAQTMLIPFLYLGTIDVLEHIAGTARKDKEKKATEVEPKENSTSEIRGREKNGALKFVIVIFVLVVLLGTVFEPYGPLDKYSQANFGLNSVLDYNTTLYDAFSAMVNLIPPNCPFVLYQNNMPEVVFHDPSSLTNYLFGYSNNFTYLVGGYYTNTFRTENIEYIIADPYSSYFLNGGSGNFSLNMYTTLRHFIQEQGYGVEAEYDGLILVKKGYTGQPLLYGPEDRTFSAYQLDVTNADNIGSNGSYYDGGYISTTNSTSGQVVWYGPYTFLQPGTYRVTLEVKATNISSANYFLSGFSYYQNLYGTFTNGSVLNYTKITGNDFSSPNTWTNITMTLTAPNFLENVEFTGQAFFWKGTFYLKEITVTQISPPNATS